MSFFDDDDAMQEGEPEVEEPEPKETQHWQDLVPADAGDVRDISKEAVWSLSSCKVEGFGIQQLLHERTDLFWQSDGPQPHTVTIEFQRKTDISFLMLYLDFKADESYTPSKIQVQTGSSILDLEEPMVVGFHEPIGWQMIDLRDGQHKRPIRAWVIQLQVVQNHQNGRDTHVRAIRVIGPAQPQYVSVRRALAANDTLAASFPKSFPRGSALSWTIR